MIDCNNTENFMNEWRRRNQWEKEEWKNGRVVIHHVFPDEIDCPIQETIEELQNWSDEHSISNEKLEVDIGFDYLIEDIRDCVDDIVNKRSCLELDKAYMDDGTLRLVFRPDGEEDIEVSKVEIINGIKDKFHFCPRVSTRISNDI